MKLAHIRKLYSYLEYYGRRISWYFRLIYVAREIRDLHIRPIKMLDRTGVYLICIVRNGSPFIREFIQYYKSIGVDHIFLLDNRSNDNTVEIAAEHEDVSVVSSNLSFGRYEFLWRHYLSIRFARHGWIISADIDEFIEIHKEFHYNVNNMVMYMDSQGFTAATGYMIDLFPSRPLDPKQDTYGWLEDHTYFDMTDVTLYDYEIVYPLNKIKTDKLKVITGGIRRKHFQIEPLLVKHPVYRLGRGLLHYGAHHIAKATIADFTLPIRHYKFGGHFVSMSEEAARDLHLYNDACEPKAYASTMMKNNCVNLYEDGKSVKYCESAIRDLSFIINPNMA